MNVILLLSSNNYTVRSRSINWYYLVLFIPFLHICCFWFMPERKLGSMSSNAYYFFTPFLPELFFHRFSGCSSFRLPIHSRDAHRKSFWWSLLKLKSIFARRCHMGTIGGKGLNQFVNFHFLWPFLSWIPFFVVFREIA